MPSRHSEHPLRPGRLTLALSCPFPGTAGPHNLHRASGVTNHRFRHAAHQEAAHTFEPVGPEDNQLGTPLRCMLDDGCLGVPFFDRRGGLKPCLAELLRGPRDERAGLPLSIPLDSRNRPDPTGESFPRLRRQPLARSHAAHAPAFRASAIAGGEIPELPASIWTHRWEEALSSCDPL